MNYLDENGYTIFTAEFLKQKGHCCESCCLHCPYDYTLKQMGLTFSGQKDSQNTFEVRLKDKVCGTIETSQNKITQLHLNSYFKNQNLTIEKVQVHFNQHLSAP